MQRMPVGRLRLAQLRQEHDREPQRHRTGAGGAAAAVLSQVLPSRQRDGDRRGKVRSATNALGQRGRAVLRVSLPVPEAPIDDTYTTEPAAGRRADGGRAPGRRQSSWWAPRITCAGEQPPRLRRRRRPSVYVLGDEPSGRLVPSRWSKRTWPARSTRRPTAFREPGLLHGPGRGAEVGLDGDRAVER